MALGQRLVSREAGEVVAVRERIIAVVKDSAIAEGDVEAAGRAVRALAIAEATLRSWLRARRRTYRTEYRIYATGGYP